MPDLSNIEFTPLFFVNVGFAVIMLVISFIIGFSISRYLKDYKIFQMIWASIRGKAKEVDRIRRLQMQEAYKDTSDIMANNGSKPTLIQKIYKMISMSGVIAKIPGFSESGFFVLITLLDLFILIFLAIKMNLLVGIVMVVIVDIIVFYLLSIAIYTRAIAVEDQMLDFINQIASTSRQYSNIIDIFGMIYEKFRNPLKLALEECYVEAKQTNNLETAMFHLKEKFDSTQFEFIIDNLLLCSKENGQYFDVATDLSKICNVYYSSFQKKKQILRQAKVNLTMMLAISVGIIFAMGNFLGGIQGLIFTTPGMIICSLILLLYLYAMNLKAR